MVDSTAPYTAEEATKVNTTAAATKRGLLGAAIASGVWYGGTKLLKLDGVANLKNTAVIGAIFGGAEAISSIARSNKHNKFANDIQELEALDQTGRLTPEVVAQKEVKRQNPLTRGLINGAVTVAGFTVLDRLVGTPLSKTTSALINGAFGVMAGTAAAAKAKKHNHKADVIDHFKEKALANAQQPAITSEDVARLRAAEASREVVGDHTANAAQKDTGAARGV